jgi:Tetratricopeptide repeat
VGRFDRDESVAVLRSRRPELSAAEADRLAAALDDVPQAVDVAGMTLAESGMSVAAYLGVLNEHEAAGGGAATRACGVAVDRLAVDDPQASDLMATLAWLGPGPVPLSVVAAPSTHPDAARLADLAAVLQRRGIARVDGGAVQLHPTAAAVIVGRGEDRGRAAAAVRLLRAAAPADPDTATWRVLLPHVLAATDPARRLDDVVLEVGWLLHSAGAYLWARGEPQAARALVEDAHDLYRRRLGPDHPDTLAAARTLADDLEALGDHEHALRVRQDAGVAGPRNNPEAG